MANVKAIIKQTNMQPIDQSNSIQIATQGLEKFDTDKDIEVFVKDRFDTEYGGVWECRVGRNIGVFSGNTPMFILFDLGQAEFLIFKLP